MNGKEFDKYLDRDLGCIHCGQTESVAPHHRANRGMGGSKVRDVPSNIIVVCSILNGAMEAVSATAKKARGYGWKLTAGQDPATTPMYDANRGEWVLLGNDFSRHVIGDAPHDPVTNS